MMLFVAYFAVLLASLMLGPWWLSVAILLAAVVVLEAAAIRDWAERTRSDGDA